MGNKSTNLSIYLSYLLRHHPEEIDLNMDEYGWVSVEELIEGINEKSKYSLDIETLIQIVSDDTKGRYKFNSTGNKIKACQGHSIKWVKQEIYYEVDKPEFLYHGTTQAALEKILESGAILKMERHAVHLQESLEGAWKSAKRWRKQVPVVIKVSTNTVASNNIKLGITENGVWCAERIPIDCIVGIIRW